MIGAVSGLFLGAVICILQLQFGLIKLGEGDGAFVINSYPVIMQWADFVYIFFTVIFIGFVAAWIPSRQISKKYLDVKLS